MSMEEKYPADCVITRTAEVAITAAFVVVVEGTADGQCNLPGGADVGGVLGVALHTAAIGDQVKIAGPGCYSRVLSSGTLTRGAWVSIHGTTGKVKNATVTADVEVVGKCMHTTTTDADHSFIYVDPFSCQGA
jgi:hypothetical protein